MEKSGRHNHPHRTLLIPSRFDSSTAGIPNRSNSCPRACISRQESGTLIRKPMTRKY